VVALLAGAYPPVLLRWEVHGAGQVKEGHPPSVGAAYCDAGWAGGGDAWEVEPSAELAAVDTAGGSIPGQGARVRHFRLLVRTGC
jgi:hypothetical protein